MSKLFDELKVGDHILKHRVVLAPLTRIRADVNLCPTDLHVEYYSQRATEGGLLITEATLISPHSIASNSIPGIWNKDQAIAWKKVTDAVHAKGGLISCQLWHQGRAAHHSYTEHHLAKEANARVCESASDIPLTSQVMAIDGTMQPHQPPHIMTLEDISRLKREYNDAAKLAIEVAGFDYVEVHGAHGYLLDQFLNDGVNQRTDMYGGSIENRARLLMEVVRGVIATVGEAKVALRLSPHENTRFFFEVYDSTVEEMYSYVFKALNEFKLAYLLITENRWDRSFSGSIMGAFDVNVTNPCTNLHTYCHLYTGGPIIGAGGFTPMTALNHFDAVTLVKDDQDQLAAVQESPLHYDAIAFGRWYISNPDLVFRLKHELPLNRYDRSTFYVTSPIRDDRINGYTDYPTFAEVVRLTLGPEVSVESVLKNDVLLKQIVDKSLTLKYPLATFEEIGGNATSLTSGKL